MSPTFHLNLKIRFPTQIEAAEKLKIFFWVSQLVYSTCYSSHSPLKNIWNPKIFKPNKSGAVWQCGGESRKKENISIFRHFELN